MEVKNFNIRTEADVFSFFLYLMKDLGLNFHPDTPFSDYMDAEDKRVFTNLQANILHVNLYSCHRIMDGMLGKDIYFMATLAYHFLCLFNHVKETGDKTAIAPLLEQIKATYFEGGLKAEPYIVNWSLGSAFKRNELNTATHYQLSEVKKGVVNLSFYKAGRLLGDMGGHIYCFSTIAQARQDLRELAKFGVNPLELPFDDKLANIGDERI